MTFILPKKSNQIVEVWKRSKNMTVAAILQRRGLEPDWVLINAVTKPRKAILTFERES